MKRILSLCMIFVLCFLTSCSLVAGDVGQLMRPPRPTGETAEIQEAMNIDLDVITMKYPKNGDFRSAYIKNDIDGDGVEEVVTFYITKAEGTTAGTMFIHVLDFSDNKWITLDKQMVKDASDVESVEFVDLDNNRRKEVIVGYSVFGSSDKMLYVYNVGNTIVESFSDSYNEYVTAPLTGETYPGTTTDVINLFLVRLKVAEPPVATARLYTFTDIGYTEVGSTFIDGHVTGYGKLFVTKALLSNCVLIDAYKGTSSMITDVVYYNPVDKNLAAPTYTAKTGLTEMTLRPVAVASKDIDGDGTTEIPYMTELPMVDPKTGETTETTGNTESSELKTYVTKWNTFNLSAPEAPTTILTAIMNYTDRYFLKVPDSWINKDEESNGRHLNICIVKDLSLHERTIYRYNSFERKAAEELFKVKVFKESEWESNGQNEYTVLSKADSLVYGLKIISDNPVLEISEENIRNNLFSLMS